LNERLNIITNNALETLNGIVIASLRETTQIWKVERNIWNILVAFYTDFGNLAIDRLSMTRRTWIMSFRSQIITIFADIINILTLH